MYSLIKLNIARPCSEKWEQMDPSETGRYCQSCKKTVVDFSAMFDDEIYQFIRQASGSVCGSFTSQQLNKLYQAPKPGHLNHFLKRIWQFLVAGSLVAHEVKSQVKTTPPESVTYSIPAKNLLPPDNDVYIVVDGTTHEPLAGATIMADGVSVTTDEEGTFCSNSFNKSISISYVGYKTRELVLRNEALPKMIALERDVDEMKEVLFTAPSHISRCERMLGGVGVGVKVTRFQNAVRNLKQWIPDSNVRVFPNPVSKGQPLNVQLSFEQPGKYLMKIFTADGKLVHAQSLQISPVKQLFQFPTSADYAPGTYWLYVQDAMGKQKGHEVKFIIR